MHVCRALPTACVLQVGAIVVSPTRELSKQIFTVAQPFVDSVPGLTTMLLVGGTCVVNNRPHTSVTVSHLPEGESNRVRN